MAGTKPFTTEQQAAVAAMLRTFPLRDQALITFLTHTGYRVSEALSLTVGDVWEAGRVRPRVRVMRGRLKGGQSCWRRSVSSRVVPLNGAVTWVLVEYLTERFGSAGSVVSAAGNRLSLNTVDPSEPLFPSRQGASPLSRWQANRVMHAVLAAAGIEAGGVRGEYGTHSLRKVFCRRIHEATGHDIMLTQAAMGHQSIETTQRYLAIDDDDVDRAVLALAGPESTRERKSVLEVGRRAYSSANSVPVGVKRRSHADAGEQSAWALPGA